MSATALEVEAELDRLLAHEAFVRSRRMRELLAFVVREELAERGDQLKGYRIGVEVLGRPEDFDPAEDAIVRVEMARLRRTLAAVYDDGSENSLRIEVPKGGNRPAFVITAPRPARAAARRPTGPGVFVVPLYGPAETEALRFGLHSELLYELARFSEFMIVDGSGFEYVPPNEQMRTASEAHDCQFLLNGRIQPAGDSARSTLQALDATTGRVLWSARFTGPISSETLLEFQERTAASIARTLATAGGVLFNAGFESWTRPPRDWQATDCILRWHYYRVYGHTAELHRDLAASVRRVLPEQPGFLMGWIILAHLVLDEYVYRIDPTAQPADVAARMRVNVDRAIALDPRSAQASYLRALQAYFLDDGEDFEALLFESLALNPNSVDLLHHGGTLLAFRGAWERGAALVDEAGMAHHNGMGYRFFHVVRALREGDLDAADVLLQSMGRSAAWYWGHLLRAMLEGARGHETGARGALERASAIAPTLAGAGAVEDEVLRWIRDPGLAEQLLGMLGAALAD